MRPLLLLIATIFFYSCSEKGPKNVLGETKMEAVMWDFIRADVFTTDFVSKDSGQDMVNKNVALQKKIFEQHKVSREDFYQTYQYYLAHTNQLATLMDSIVAKQSRARLKAAARPAVLNPKDTLVK